MHGSADTLVDPGNGKLLADRIPGAQLVIFPEPGHLLFWEDPDGFVDASPRLLADRVPRNVLHAGRRKHSSFDAAAISVNSGLSWNFSVEESGRPEAEVSEALITIVIDGHRVGPEEVRWGSNGNHLLVKNGPERP